MITEIVHLIDITRPIYPGMPVWPGDPPVVEEPVSRIADGDSSNVTRFMLGSHTGTHIDAPWHFESGGATVESLPLEILCGDCRVVDLSDIRGLIAADDLSSGKFGPSRRLLIRTRNSLAVPDVFHKDFVALSPDAADWIVGQGICLLGIDGPSVEEYGSSAFPVHHALLRAGVVIVEGLDLSGVTAGDYHLFCAPLKWSGADGAPVRVFLKKF